MNNDDDTIFTWTSNERLRLKLEEAYSAIHSLEGQVMVKQKEYEIVEDMCRKLILELDEYKEVGTVDECRVAVDKLALLEACDEIEENNK